jgi:hypothetical protein
LLTWSANASRVIPPRSSGLAASLPALLLGHARGSFLAALRAYFAKIFAYFFAEFHCSSILAKIRRVNHRQRFLLFLWRIPVGVLQVGQIFAFPGLRGNHVLPHLLFPQRVFAHPDYVHMLNFADT